MLQPSTALILISGTGNYFYNVAGYKLAHTLQSFGWQVEVATLRTVPERRYTWGFLLNTTDLVASVGDEAEARRLLTEVRRRCDFLVLWLLEAVHTNWFERALHLAQHARIDFLFDCGLQSQSVTLPWGIHYRFVFGGLTIEEKLQAPKNFSPTTRPIPWTFVGHSTPTRVRLVHRLVNTTAPHGFVYLPGIGVMNATNAHLSEAQLMNVLQKSQAYIWCTHHANFYMEIERFRMALLAGALPLKILTHPLQAEHAQLFKYLIFAEHNFFEGFAQLDLTLLFPKFCADFCALPSFEESVRAVLAL